jgi:predicted DCC family thiol-disulfide oxidoreductase YuxK
MTGPRRLTVLYDAGCPICRTARDWLAGRDQLVPLAFVAAGSVEARALFPGLDQAATLRDVTVVADTGAVYTGDAAWLMCLWALSGYRSLALRLAAPRLRPLARRVVSTAAGLRDRFRTDGYGQDCDDDACAAR